MDFRPDDMHGSTGTNLRPKKVGLRDKEQRDESLIAPEFAMFKPFPIRGKYNREHFHLFGCRKGVITEIPGMVLANPTFNHMHYLSFARTYAKCCLMSEGPQPDARQDSLERVGACK